MSLAACVVCVRCSRRGFHLKCFPPPVATTRMALVLYDPHRVVPPEGIEISDLQGIHAWDRAIVSSCKDILSYTSSTSVISNNVTLGVCSKDLVQYLSVVLKGSVALG